MTEEDLLAETSIKNGDNIFRIDIADIERKLRDIPMVSVCLY
jgi:cell division septal protein FtsQ